MNGQNGWAVFQAAGVGMLSMSPGAWQLLRIHKEQSPSSAPVQIGLWSVDLQTSLACVNEPDSLGSENIVVGHSPQ